MKCTTTPGFQGVFFRQGCATVSIANTKFSLAHREGGAPYLLPWSYPFSLQPLTYSLHTFSYFLSCKGAPRIRLLSYLASFTRPSVFRLICSVACIRTSFIFMASSIAQICHVDGRRLDNLPFVMAMNNASVNAGVRCSSGCYDEMSGRV